MGPTHRSSGPAKGGSVVLLCKRERGPFAGRSPQTLGASRASKSTMLSWFKIKKKQSSLTAVRAAVSESDPRHPPCPYCHAPLATPQAKYCCKCRYDWHDPENVKKPIDPNWNRFGLDANLTYVVELLQHPSGIRTTKYRIADQEPSEAAVFETVPASGKLFIEWGYYEYAKHLLLSNGKRFHFEAHGIWLLDEEIAYLERQRSSSLPAPWVNGISPKFAPK